MDNNGHLPPVPWVVIDLNARRNDLRVPTLLAATLAEIAGASIRSCRPGRVEATMPEGSITLRIRLANIYEDEAKAYRLAGLPVPEEVASDLARWNRAHGR